MLETFWVVQDRKFYDLTKLKRMGEVRYLLDQDDSAMAHQPVILKLKRKLLDFKEQDSLVMIGAPSLILAAAVLVSDYNQRKVPVLLFDKITRQYYRKVFKF